MLTGIASAGLSAAAGLGTAYLNNKAQVAMNQANLQNQWDMFDAQVDLANTAHQREVQDLRAAGLNPILSASGGNGSPVVAQTPTELHPSKFDAFINAAQQIGTLLNQEKTANASLITAEAADKNAESNQWQLWDSKSEGNAGFKVAGFGSDASVRIVQSVRINKVTGEAFTLDGKPVKIVGAVKKTPKGEVTVRMEDWHHDGSSKSVNTQLRRQKRTNQGFLGAW